MPRLLHLALFVALCGAAGCGDRCVVLCQQTARTIANCRSDALIWPDVGARNRQDFISECRADWDRASADLSSNDLRVALEVCDDVTRDLGELSCEEVTALYAMP